MKHFTILVLGLFMALQVEAQTNSFLSGIVRKNYYTYVYNPIDSSILSQQFDSATVRLGVLNALTGQVNNVGTYTFNDGVNLTGAALNPYTNSYIFVGYSDVITLDLTTGQVSNRVPFSNPLGASYFDNFRFNNADSTMYGLARRNTVNPTTGQITGAMYLAKANTNTGVITQISPTSIGQGFALAGSAIDPYQMVYYYSTGSTLMGLDIYNGSIYSNPTMVLPQYGMFDNFTYSCADTALYGLVRQNFYTGTTLDSAIVKLGRINPTTGVVTVISPYALSASGYSLNAGAAIDPSTMTYYFSDGANIIGVSLITGLETVNEPLVFSDGMYFDLMRNYDNCIDAIPNRPNPSTGTTTVTNKAAILVYPNPTSDLLTVSASNTIERVELSGLDGRIVLSQNGGTSSLNVDMHDLPQGLYFAKVFMTDGVVMTEKVLLTK